MMKKILLTFFLLISFSWGQENEKIIEKWDNGVVKIKHYYKGQGFDEELIGIKSYYKNGGLKWKSRYLNGKRHGEYSFYLEGNELLLKGNFDNGDTFGTNWYAYHPEEMSSTKGPNYFSKKLSGFDAVTYQATDVRVNTSFYDNGELEKYEVKYTLKVKDDKWGKYPHYDDNYYWHENGMIKKITYYYGLPHADNYGFSQKIWFDSGELDSEMEARDKMETLKFTTYYKNGNKKSEMETLNGTRIYYWLYDKNGNITNSY
jgi:antitoxin component YwqK of YwqJK toxin-antitoxin module